MVIKELETFCENIFPFFDNLFIYFFYFLIFRTYKFYCFIILKVIFSFFTDIIYSCLKLVELIPKKLS